MVVDELGCGWEQAADSGTPSLEHTTRRVALCAPARSRAEMLAVAGTRLGLIPHPAAEPSDWLVLVEGPPDMISGRSRGVPAVTVPGDHAWEREWARLFAGRRVSVVMDSDQAGRVAAERIAGDLRAAGVHGAVIDLAPGREDGYDLSDWLFEHRDWSVERIRVALGYRGAEASAAA